MKLFKALMSEPAQAAAKAPPAPPRNDIAEPNPEKAKQFAKGMSEKPDYLDNLLKGIGIRK